MRFLRCIGLATRQIILGPAFYDALRRNEEAAAQLDAVVREVLRR